MVPFLGWMRPVFGLESGLFYVIYEFFKFFVFGNSVVEGGCMKIPIFIAPFFDNSVVHLNVIFKHFSG